MSGNSGDNWDLISTTPGKSGRLPMSPGFEIPDTGALMSRIRNFYDDGVGAWEENRRMHSEDLNFIYNSEAMGQWDPVVLQNRRGKPCYTFNRCIGPVNIVIADMRQTRPSGKVRPSSDGASEPVAEIYEGLCRSIEQCSRAEQIYMEQYKFAVAGGFGAWRLMPSYMSDDGDGAFDQVIRIVNIANPQTVVWDPQCADACAGDANRCIVAERISEDIYDSLYRDGDGQSFQMSRDSYGWYTDKEVRIAEYFERVPREKWIAQMTDGSVRDYDTELKRAEAHFDAEGITYEKHGVTRIARYPDGQLKTRRTVKWQVMWCKVDGTNVLEGPYYYDWKRIPVVRCPGRYINIEGRKKFQGLIRHAKDAQRSYNSRASDMIERSALIPKAPYLVTESMIKGFEGEWNQANVQSRPYLPYNVDPKAPEQMPHRMEPLDLPQGAIALAQMSIQDIQATIGAYDVSLGNAEDANRVSGKALVQHTKRSDLGSYEFVDGYRSAQQLTWEMMIDMIPTVYDSERVERIIGRDGIDKMVTLNQPQESLTADGEEIINDLKAGTYDVQVNLGPTYQSARQEALETLLGFAEAMPESAGVIGDLIAKNIDTPDAQEMARRLRIPLIQQGLIQPTESEKGQVPSQTPAQQAQAAMQQLEQQLLQAKTKKMQADSTIAESKAQSAPVEQQKLQMEVAGKHLGNMKTAMELHQGQNDTQAEAASHAMDLGRQHVQNEMELTQAEHQHRQSIAHTHASHVADVMASRSSAEADEKREQERHEREERRKEEAHRRDLEREHAKHQQKLKYNEELNKQKVALTKAQAAAKPKPAAKKKAA